MKKFLFTLAALLMVGTVCAENYWYIDDFQVTQAQLGTNNQRIDVKAHYDQYVSAIQATFTMPEGLQIRTYRAGSDLTMSGYDDLGDPLTSTPDLQFLPDHIENFIVASMASCYDQDGNLLGAFHWAPGDYAQMIQIVLIIDENFAGGEITVMTEPSSSGWADGSQDCPKNEEWTRTCTVTVEGAEPPTPAQTEKPTLYYEEVDGGYLVTAVGDGTVTIYVEDIQVAQEEGTATYFIPYNPEGEEYGVSATAQAPDELVSEPAVITVEDPGQTAKPTIVYNEETHTVTVTGYGDINVLIEGYGEGDVITLTGNDEVTYTFELLDEEYEVTVSATAQDEGQRVSDYAIKDFVVPAKEPVTPDQVGAPKFDGYSVDGVTGYGVYITPTTEGSDIKYRVFVWVPNEEGDTQHVGDLEYGHWDMIQDWTEYQGVENEIWKTEVNQSYRVEAYAYIGDVTSNTVAYEFTVTYPTGIDEMMGGKTVAGVRYFNMAGQEMQEANGVTIVVTTYTDGTTSAVKVMK